MSVNVVRDTFAVNNRETSAWDIGPIERAEPAPDHNSLNADNQRQVAASGICLVVEPYALPRSMDLLPFDPNRASFRQCQ
jgi:hypothetical protein